MQTLEFNTIEELEAKLLDFKILFAYHSNKIENDNTNFHDTREIFEKGNVVNYTGDLRTLYEIANQKDCYYYLLNKIVKKVPLSIDCIQKIHYLLSKGTYDEYRYNVNKERPGEFKKHDYVTGLHEVGSSYENVENNLQELIDEVNEYQGDNYLLVAAYFHAMFENIHPFADANGRVGRTLMNYYLLIHNIKPIIIYENDRKLYYECLEKFDEENDLSPLEKFIEYEQERTWKKPESKKRGLNSYCREKE